jgi:hypothetical protein
LNSLRGFVSPHIVQVLFCCLSCCSCISVTLNYEMSTV